MKNKKKTIKGAIIFLVVALMSIGTYLVIIYPNSYNYDTAVKNGDVVMGAGGPDNVDKLHAFIMKVENKQSDKIRITAYSKEGYPTIFDLDFDGKIITCTTDNTRNRYGRDELKNQGKYTKIIKNEMNDYFLVDELGENENKWIFQE